MRKTIDRSFSELEKMDLSSLLKESVYAVNAFICGIWNGLVEAICGIFSLVQYLFQGAVEIADLLENFKEKGPMLLGQIDDCILAFQELDFGQIFATLATNIKKWALSDSTTSIVEIAYFSGMFIGIVVELAIEIAVGIIFTGGILSLEAIMAKLGETFKALGNLLIGALKLPFKVAEKSISSLLKSLKWLYEFLSKGTDEIVKLVDEVFGKFKSLGAEALIINKQLENELLDALGWSEKNASKRKFFLSREYLKQKDIKALEKYIAKKFEGLGIKLVTGADKYLDSNNARAGFNPVNRELIFRKKFTFYEAFHELKHAEEFKLLGEAEYLKGANGSLADQFIRTYKREKYVFDKIMEKQYLFNPKELENAKKVFQIEIDKLERAGIDYTKL